MPEHYITPSTWDRVCAEAHRAGVTIDEVVDEALNAYMQVCEAGLRPFEPHTHSSECGWDGLWFECGRREIAAPA